ncbi:MAG: hypothetical protein AAF995_07625, partial [Planctomycetota bacterium]
MPGNIDDILNELGVDSGAGKAAGKGGGKPSGKGGPKPPAKGRGKPHRLDRQTSTFSSLPSVPSGQGEDGAAEHDPAVKRERALAKASEVGSAEREIYRPDDSGPDAIAEELGRALVSREVVTGEQLSAAERVLAQTPGARLA